MFSSSPAFPATRVLIFALLAASLTFLVVYFVDFDQAALVFDRLTSSSNSSLVPREVIHLNYARMKRPLPRCAADRTVPARSFLMVFMSRSGSTAISQTMSLHPRIEHGFEFLRSIPQSDNDNALNKTRAFFDAAIAKGKIPGFKLRSTHIHANPQAWYALAKKYDTRIIWQYRKNVFKTALGIYARRVLNDSTATGGIGVKEMDGVEDRCDMGVGCSFKIKVWEEFHGIMTGRLRQDTDMMKAVNVVNDGRDCMFELPYEDYLYYKEETIRDLFAFLGLKAQSMDTFRVKATKDSLCEVVENFDELCDKFYGCPIWQPYLDDFDNDCRCTGYSKGSEEFCSMYAQKELDAILTGTY